VFTITESGDKNLHLGVQEKSPFTWRPTGFPITMISRALGRR
jgi:hypothetical protein